MMRRRLKGAVTVFVSMLLSSMIILILVLTKICIYASEKVRFEGDYDIAMNSVLGEYSKALKDRFELIYIDATYLNKVADVENIRQRIDYYLSSNIEGQYKKDNSVWGNLSMKSCELKGYQTATMLEGSSMRRQASLYIENANKESLLSEVGAVCELSDMSVFSTEEDPLEDWSDLMETIDGMELPKIKNAETGEDEEVSLDNPASWAFANAQSGILYLTNCDMSTVSSVCFPTEDLVSNCYMESLMVSDPETKEDSYFYAYLLDKMSSYEQIYDDSFPMLQLEYIAAGRNSDYENFLEIANLLYKVRFKANLSEALADQKLCNDAIEYAAGIEVCILDEDFIEPVAKSMIYACAFMESVSDMRCLFNQGRVELSKSSHNMSISGLLAQNMYFVDSSEGISYRQYLLALILLMDYGNQNLKTMDMMETSIRYCFDNPYFSMNYCVERLLSRVSCNNSFGKTLTIERIYGYY